MPKWKLDKFTKEMNDKRASWACNVLTDFGNKSDLDMIFDSETVVRDLIIDIAHWCDRNDVSLYDVLQRARRFYALETEDQGQQF